MKLQMLRTIFNNNRLVMWSDFLALRAGEKDDLSRRRVTATLTWVCPRLQSSRDQFIFDMTVNITGSLLTEALCGPRSAAAGNLQSEQRDRRRPTASPSRYILMKYYYLVWKLRSPSGVLAVIASRYCFKCAFCFCLRVLIYYMRESSCCVTSRRQACRRMKITWGSKTVQLLCGQRKCFLQRIEGLSHLTMIAFLFRVISQFQVISKKLFGQTSLIGWPSYRCVCAWRAAIDFKGRFKQGERGQIVSFFPPPASQQWKSVQVGTTGHPSSSALSSPNSAHTLM